MRRKSDNFAICWLVVVVILVASCFVLAHWMFK